jgi:hypothetical protein
MTPAILHCVPGALYRADIADQHSRLADALHGANNTDTAFRTLLNERVPGGQPITAADVLYGVYQHGGRIVLQPDVLQDLLQHAQEPRSPHAAGAHQLLALATQLSMLHATHCADGSRALKLEALQESGQLLNNLARYFLGKSANEVSVPGFVINDDSHGVVDRLKGVVNGALQRCAGDIGEQLIERISKPVALANLERWENDHPGELPDNERAFAIAVKGKGSEAASRQRNVFDTAVQQGLEQALLSEIPYARQVRIAFADDRLAARHAEEGLARLGIDYRRLDKRDSITLSVQGALQDSELLAVRDYVNEYYRLWGDRYVHFAVELKDDWLKGLSFQYGPSGYVKTTPSSWYFPKPL